MKRLTEWTDEEILNMTASGREILIDLECAHAGIALLPPFYGPKPAAPKPKTIDAYFIGNLYFIRKADADNVLVAIQKTEFYKTDGYNETERLVKVESGDEYYYPVVKTKKLPTEAHFKECEAEIAAYTVRKNKWEAERRDYDKIFSSRQRIISEIDDRINDIEEVTRRKESLSIKFERYLVLAEGNPSIAINFLRSAEELTVEEDKFIDELAVESWEHDTLEKNIITGEVEPDSEYNQ